MGDPQTGFKVVGTNEVEVVVLTFTLIPAKYPTPRLTTTRTAKMTARISFFIS